MEARKGNKKMILLAMLLVGVLAFAYVLYSLLSDGTGAGAPAANEDRIAAPEFTAWNADGAEVRFSDYAGVPIVLNFWASWCDPCKREMPDFQAIYEESQASQLQFLMVNLTDGARETRQSAETFLEQYGYSFPVLFDEQQHAAMVYGVRAIPSTIFIYADGTIAGAVEGTLTREALETGIELIVQ